MNQFARANKPCQISDSLHQRLNAYALAAGAAGVGLLALVQPSEAEIIYSRTHHVVGNGGRYKLDLNHDGTVDLTFQNTYFHTCTTQGDCKTNQTLTAKLDRTNAIVYDVRYGAVAMKPGMQIGPKCAFGYGRQKMARVGVLGGSSATGSWINVTDRYLGVRFKIRGKTHYGWARLSVQVDPLQITATLTGYAYESVPKRPIIAGKTKGAEVITLEPGNLGRLAQGSAGRSRR